MKCMDCGERILELESEKERGICIHCEQDIRFWHGIDGKDYRFINTVWAEVMKGLCVKDAQVISDFACLPSKSLNKVIQ